MAAERWQVAKCGGGGVKSVLLIGRTGGGEKELQEEGQEEEGREVSAAAQLFPDSSNSGCREETDWRPVSPTAVVVQWYWRRFTWRRERTHSHTAAGNSAHSYVSIPQSVVSARQYDRDGALNGGGVPNVACRF